MERLEKRKYTVKRIITIPNGHGLTANADVYGKDTLVNLKIL